MKYLLRILLAIFLVLNFSCKKKENELPTVTILNPLDGERVMQGDQVNIHVEADDSDGTVVEIVLYIDGVNQAQGEGSRLEYEWDTQDAPEGEYTITAVARDDGSGAQADNITLLVDVTGGLNPDLSYGEMTDLDGNKYATIDIGDQVWMAENLRVTHYADGSAIPLVADESAWEALDASAEAYSWYDNQSANGETYGGLYTWGAAVQGVCPDGWHIPSDEEWKQLELSLGMSQEQADKQDWRGTSQAGLLKERGYSHWDVPNSGGENASGFTAIPGGFRSSKGGFYKMGQDAVFWTSSEAASEERAWYRTLNFDNLKVYRHYNDKTLGLSVRCVKDSI